jgi:uncharacterized membrane protein YhhN
MIPQHWPALLCIACLAILMVGEFKQDIRIIAAAKTTASTAFIITALQNNALQNQYGQLVFAALILSWWGDVFLIPKSKTIFKIGILAFLLAHFGFAAAFISLGFDAFGAGLGLFAVILIGSLVIRWLYPHLEADMKVPVTAYVLVISSMVLCACATFGATQRWDILLGATMFFVSDLAVARNRFVKEGFDNKVWGLPLYYGAQLVLAYSVG